MLFREKIIVHSKNHMKNIHIPVGKMQVFSKQVIIVVTLAYLRLMLLSYHRKIYGAKKNMDRSITYI
jgi:hypothetical protein